MITIIVSSIIGTFLFFFVVKPFKDCLFDYIFISLFIGIVVFALLGAMIALIIPAKNFEKHESFFIYNLQDNSSNYVFYVKNMGLYEKRQIDFKKVKIKHTDSIPKLHVFTITPSKAIINKFAIDVNWGKSYYVIESPFEAKKIKQ